MKKTLFAFVAFSLALLAISCNRLDNPTGDETGMLYGTWVLDTYRIEVSGSKDDQSSAIPVEIPYALKKTTLTLDEDMKAYAHMGWETDWANYSYDAAKQQIVFDHLMEVSDDGLVMVLYGRFDVAQLDENQLVLKQPYVQLGDFELPSGTVLSTAAVAWYTYHREK